MLDFKQFNLALNQIVEEKGISKEKILETIEMALAAAYKKDYGKKGQIVRAKFDPESGDISFSQVKIVVDQDMLKPEPQEGEEQAEAPIRDSEGEFGDEFEEGQVKKVRFNPERHIMIEEAKKEKSGSQPGDELVFPLETKGDYGRIAAQTAKQVITQRIREAERDVVFDEYHSKQGEVISGVVQRVEGGRVYVELGRTIGLMFPEERIPGEHYHIGSRIRAYVLSVERLAKGPSILLSRSHPRFVNKLFEMEVPEIASGVVEIRSIAREAGSRTKVAVLSNDKGIDPIGSLVGQKGTRVSTVITELGGEKVDIVEWAEDQSTFVRNALSPAKVVEVELHEKRREAKVLVPNDQLSLAIGRGGQNVRLAAKLTGWKIDVRNVIAPDAQIEGGVSSETEGEELPLEPREDEEGGPAVAESDETARTQTEADGEEAAAEVGETGEIEQEKSLLEDAPEEEKNSNQ